MNIPDFRTQIREEILRQKEDEQMLLHKIAAITSINFSEQAASDLDSAKHLYSFGGYLSMLRSLLSALSAGMPPDTALDVVQTGWPITFILDSWKRN